MASHVGKRNVAAVYGEAPVPESDSKRMVTRSATDQSPAVSLPNPPKTRGRKFTPTAASVQNPTRHADTFQKVMEFLLDPQDIFKVLRKILDRKIIKLSTKGQSYSLKQLFRKSLGNAKMIHHVDLCHRWVFKTDVSKDTNIIGLSSLPLVCKDYKGFFDARFPKLYHMQFCELGTRLLLGKVSLFYQTPHHRSPILIFANAITRGSPKLVRCLYEGATETMRLQLLSKNGPSTFNKSACLVQALDHRMTETSVKVWEELFSFVNAHLVDTRDFSNVLLRGSFSIGGPEYSIFFISTRNHDLEGFCWFIRSVGNLNDPRVIGKYERLMLEVDEDGHTFVYRSVARAQYNVLCALRDSTPIVLRKISKVDNLLEAVLNTDDRSEAMDKTISTVLPLVQTNITCFRWLIQQNPDDYPRSIECIFNLYFDRAIRLLNSTLLQEVFDSAYSVDDQVELLEAREPAESGSEFRNQRFIEALDQPATEQRENLWERLYNLVRTVLAQRDCSQTLLGDIFHTLTQGQYEDGIVWLLQKIASVATVENFAVYSIFYDLIHKEVDEHTFLYEAVRLGKFRIVQCVYELHRELFKSSLNLESAILEPGIIDTVDPGIDGTVAFLLEKRVIGNSETIQKFVNDRQGRFPKSLLVIQMLGQSSGDSQSQSLSQTPDNLIIRM